MPIKCQQSRLLHCRPLAVTKYFNCKSIFPMGGEAIRSMVRCRCTHTDSTRLLCWGCSNEVFLLFFPHLVWLVIITVAIRSTLLITSSIVPLSPNALLYTYIALCSRYILGEHRQGTFAVSNSYSLYNKTPSQTSCAKPTPERNGTGEPSSRLVWLHVHGQCEEVRVHVLE